MPVTSATAAPAERPPRVTWQAYPAATRYAHAVPVGRRPERALCGWKLVDERYRGADGRMPRCAQCARLAGLVEQGHDAPMGAGDSVESDRG